MMDSSIKKMKNKMIKTQAIYIFNVIRFLANKWRIILVDIFLL